jgi:hypothetical protein
MSQSSVKLSCVVFYGKLKSLKLNEKSVQSKHFFKNVNKNTFYFTTSPKTT